MEILWETRLAAVTSEEPWTVRTVLVTGSTPLGCLGSPCWATTFGLCVGRRKLKFWETEAWKWASGKRVKLCRLSTYSWVCPKLYHSAVTCAGCEDKICLLWNTELLNLVFSELHLLESWSSLQEHVSTLDTTVARRMLDFITLTKC